jgi:hypothetical protein
LGNENLEQSFHICFFAKLDFFRIASKYIRKSSRKLMFMEELFNEARRRMLHGENQRKEATVLGTKE